MASSAKRAGARGRAGGGPGEAAPPGAVVIKKYANRRLYNTATSGYVTLDGLCRMVKDGEDFVVYDARTGEDITRSVLTQIIVEEEAKGSGLLPVSFLRQLIGFYGDSLQTVVPRYLDHAMATFAENRERTRSHMQNAFGGLFPFDRFDEMSERNMAMFERAMAMFAPPGAAAPDNGDGRAAAPPDGDGDAAPPDAPADPLRAMQEQLDRLQRQVRELSAGRDGGA